MPVLIFVTARPVAGSALAFAGHCQEDQGRSPADSWQDGEVPRYIPRRPTVGHMNIDPATVFSLADASVGESGEGDVAEVDAALSVILHEVVHALGFTYQKLVQLPCPGAPAFDRFAIGGSARRSLHSGGGDGGGKQSNQSSSSAVREASRHQNRRAAESGEGGELSPPPPPPASPSSYDGSFRPCELAGSIEPVVSRVVAGRSRSLLATPQVLATARRHYGCTCDAGGGSDDGGGCLVGMPLEDCLGSADCSEGSGTAGGHWEKRVAKGELMVGTAGGGHRAPVSELTLAVFEDAGWYMPNYQVDAPRCFYDPAWCEAHGRRREPFLWGKDRGCAFVNSMCDGDAWRVAATSSAPPSPSTSHQYWCAAEPTATDEAITASIGTEGCTLGRLAVGHCTLYEHSLDLPSAFQYFPSQPKLGGRAMEDYCPLWEPFTNWDCRVASTHADALTAATQRGETRCEQCRCFANTLANSSSSATLAASERHGCYEHRCLSPSQLQIRVGAQWHDCPPMGGAVAAALSGWHGGVSCPPAAELCTLAPDLAWPAVTKLEPRRGPAAGGTKLTISGSQLYASDRGGGGGGLPRVRICNLDVVSVSILEGGGGNSSSGEGGAGGDDTVGDDSTSTQRLLVITAPLPRPSAAELWGESGSGRTSLDVSCHLILLSADGREALALNAFSYAREPLSCQILTIGELDWSVPQLISLYVCLWPFVITALVGLCTLRCAWRAARRLGELKRAEEALGTWEVRVGARPL